MKRVSSRRLEKVLGFLRETHEAQDLDTFARTVPAAIARLIDADVVTYSEVNPARKRVAWHYQPGAMPILDFRSAFERFMHTDPLVVHYANGADGRTTKISDLMTQREFHSLPIYSEFYRHLELEHQVAFLLDTVKPLLVGMTLNRSSKDFTEEDRDTLDLLRPHLIQAYRNADRMTRSQREIALMTRGIEDMARGIILLTRDRLIVRATPRARHWLSEYFAWPRGGSNRRLPEPLDRWLRHEVDKRVDPGSVASPAAPFSVERGDGALIVTAATHEDGLLLLLDQRLKGTLNDSRFQRALQCHGLSRREAEVLSWVGQGKTNPEIAVILSVSPRTVQTHLDHIYRKLDVQTRAAATAKAMELAGLAV
jgi:DNA-binding CsgD family transcriptional regulator